METSAYSGADGGDGGISSLLSSETRGFLVSPTGAKVSLKELEGNIIGLYFAANWYSKCEDFTAVLANVHRQLKGRGFKFEVILVSSDEDQSCFDRFHGMMPWPAIPFNDLQSKRSLTERFLIEGIPSLMILDVNGELIQTEGVDLVYRYGSKAFPFTSERISELEAEEKEKHDSQSLEKLLSVDGKDYAMSHEGQVSIVSRTSYTSLLYEYSTYYSEQLQVPIKNMLGKTVGLYFSAQWCPPCSKFTPKLATIYDTLKAKNEEFEVVFVSMDRGEAGYVQCFSGMPWLALPYNEEYSKTLSRYFNVQGIPILIIIGPDGKTVTREGRHLINLHLDMAFPFTETQLSLLRERMDEEAKSYPSTLCHVGHHHALTLVSEKSGGGPFICCECDEQGLGWAYLCLRCGYEVHLKCVREAKGDSDSKKLLASADSFSDLSSSWL